MSAFVKGFVVVRTNSKAPAGKPCSRVFHARTAAEDFAELARRGDPESRYHVAEKVGYDKGIESIR